MNWFSLDLLYISLVRVFIILPHTSTYTHTNICKYMHVQCTVQKRLFSCKINRLFRFVTALNTQFTAFVYFSDLHAASLHKLWSLIFKIPESFLMCALVFYKFHITCNKCSYEWKYHFELIMVYKTLDPMLKMKDNVWDISKIKAFFIWIFNSVLPLIGGVIYREQGCKLLV